MKGLAKLLPDVAKGIKNVKLGKWKKKVFNFVGPRLVTMLVNYLFRILHPSNLTFTQWVMYKVFTGISFLSDRCKPVNGAPFSLSPLAAPATVFVAYEAYSGLRRGEQNYEPIGGNAYEDIVADRRVCGSSPWGFYGSFTDSFFLFMAQLMARLDDGWRTFCLLKVR